MYNCMTSVTKTGTPTVTVGLFAALAAMVAKVRAAIETQVPVGYQDETGFHTGVKPRDGEAAGISDW